MASEDDFDLDDENFDDFDDMDFDELDGEVTDDRSPATKVGSAFKEAVKFQATNPQTIEDFARTALPDEYGRSLSKVQEIGNMGADLYRQTAKEAEPGLKNLRKLADKNMDKIEKFLPAKLANKLKEKIQSDKDRAAFAKASDENDQITSSLDAIFKQRELAKTDKEAIDDEIEDQREEIKEKRESANTSFMQAAADHLSRIVGYQESVLTSFQRKTLELQYRQFFVARDQLEYIRTSNQKSGQLLEAIVKNTALPEITKLKMSEAAEGSIRERLMGAATDKIGNYAANFLPSIKRNVQTFLSEKVEAFNDGTEKIMDMQDEDAPALDRMTILGDLAGSMGSSFLFKKLAEKLAPTLSENETIKKFGLDLDNFFSNLSGKVLKWKDEDSDNGVIELLKEMIPELQKQSFNDQSDVLRNDNFVENRKEILERSIIEIIPGYLSKISRWTEYMATGRDNGGEKYNLFRGGFTTEEEYRTDVKNQIVSNNSAAVLYTGGEEVLDKFDKDKSLSKGARSAFRAAMLKQAQTGKPVDIENLASEDFYGETTSADIKKELAELFGSISTGKDMTVEAKEGRNMANRYLASIASSVSNYDDLINKISYYGGRDMLREMGAIRMTAGGTNEIDTRLIDRELLSLTEKIEANEELRAQAAEQHGKFKEKTEPKKEEKGFFSKLADGVKKKKKRQEERAGTFVENSETFEVTPEQIEDLRSAGAFGKADESGFVEESSGKIDVSEVEIERVRGEEQQKLTDLFEEHHRLEAARRGETTTTVNEIEIDTRDLATAANQERLIKLIEECCEEKGLLMKETLEHVSNIDLNVAEMMKGGGDGYGYGLMNATVPMEGEGFFSSLMTTLRAGGSALFGAAREDDPDTEIDESRDDGLLLKTAKGVGGIYKKLFGFGGSLLKMGGSAIDGLAGTPVQDIYMEGVEKPIMEKALLKKGHYIDVETEKPIRYPEDVTGPVMDLESNIIIDETDTDKRLFVIDEKKGFIERNAGRLGGLMSKGAELVGGVYGGLWNTAKSIWSYISEPTIADIFVSGEDTPRLKKHLLEKGFYFDKVTGKVIKTIEDIQGAVVDAEGNEILSLEELKGDLYSRYTGIVNIWEKVKSGASDGFSWAKGKIPDLLSKGMELGKGYLEFVGNFYGSLFDTLGETLNFTGSRVKDNERYNRDVLIEIRDILNTGLLDGEYESQAGLFDETNRPGLYSRLKERFTDRWVKDKQETEVEDETEKQSMWSKLKGVFTQSKPTQEPLAINSIGEQIKERSILTPPPTKAVEEPPKAGLWEKFKTMFESKERPEESVFSVRSIGDQLEKKSPLTAPTTHEEKKGLLSKVTDNLSHPTMPLMINAVEGVKSALPSVDLPDSVTTVKDYISKTIPSGKSKLEELKEQAQGFVSDPKKTLTEIDPKELYEQVKAVVSGGLSDVELPAQAQTKIQNMMSIVKDHSRGKISLEEMQDRLVSFVSDASPTMGDRLSREFERVRESTEHVKETFTEVIGVGGSDNQRDTDSDQDDDGLRDGSWQAQRAAKEGSKLDQLIELLRNKFSKEDKGERVKKESDSGGLLDSLKEKFQAMKDRFMGGAEAAGDLADLGGDGPDRRRGGKKPGLLKRIGGKLWGATKTAAKFIPGAGLATGAISSIGSGLAAAGTATLSVLSAPVVLTGLAVAGVGLLGYMAYKKFSVPDVNEYDHVRYKGYGIDWNDKDQLKKIALLEDELEDVISFTENGAVLKGDQLDLNELADAVGIDAEDNPEAYQEFLNWLSGRFRKFYLLHKTALKKLDADETSDLDEETGPKYLKMMGVPESDPVWSNTAKALGAVTITSTAADYAQTKTTIKSELESDSGDGKSKGARFKAPVAELTKDPAKAAMLARSVAPAASITKSGGIELGSPDPSPTTNDFAMKDQIDQIRQNSLKSKALDQQITSTKESSRVSDGHIRLLQEQLNVQRRTMTGVNDLNDRFEALVRVIGGGENSMENFTKELKVVRNDRQKTKPNPSKTPKIDMS